MLLNVLGAGLFAGLVAIFVTLAIERWGGRLGGVLGTVPSTIVPAAVGMAARAPSETLFSDAIHTAPVGILINVLFLYLWRLVPPRLPLRNSRAKLGAMVLLSLGVWLVAAVTSIAGLRWLRQVGISPSATGLGATLLIGAAGVVACLRPLPAPRGSQPVRLPTLLGRGVMAGCAVGFAVWLVSTPHALLAGVAAVFPAIFLTTMVSLWLAQGQAVQAGAVGPMMLGSASVACFAMLAGVLIPVVGMALGTTAGWLGSVALVTAPAALWLGRAAAPPSAPATTE